MAREQEFDTDDALEKATKIFWSQGYKKSSVRQLQEAMDIGESSFYNSFKSKKNLYLKCLENYNAKVTASRMKAFQSNKSTKMKLKDFFNIIASDQNHTSLLKGCLMTNSLSSEVLSDDEIKNYIVDQFEKYREHFNNLFLNAIKNNELPKNFDTKSASELIIIHIQGIFKLSLISKDFKEIKKSSALLINLLGLK